MSLTYLSVFSGAGLADLGAIAAGLEPIGAVEFDSEIAAIHQLNFSHPCLIQDALDVDWRQYSGVDMVHLSPSCKPLAFGSANGKPEDHPQWMSSFVPAVVARTLKPRILSVEQSQHYLKSEPGKALIAELEGLGYHVLATVANAKHYAVPQDRKRTVILATRDRAPILPMGGAVCGWWRATRDLIPNLPVATPTRYQQATLKNCDGRPCLVQRVGTTYRGGMGRPAKRSSTQPSIAVRAFGRGCDRHGVRQMNVWDGEVLRSCTVDFYRRLMGVPDDFRLGDDECLAVEVLGNGYPPPFAQAMFEAAVRATGAIAQGVAA